MMVIQHSGVMLTDMFFQSVKYTHSIQRISIYYDRRIRYRQQGTEKEPGEEAGEIVFTAGLSPGVYLVTITGKSYIVTKKLINK